MIPASASEWIVRALDSILVGAGDCCLVAMCFVLLRLRNARTRRLFWAAALLHVVSSFALRLSPFNFIRVDVAHDGSSAMIARIDSAAPWSCGVWLALVAAFVIWRIAAGHRSLRVLRGFASLALPAPAHLDADLRAIASRTGRAAPPIVVLPLAMATPFVFGLRRPLLCIPSHLVDALPRDELRAVLGHELAHLRGNDLWVALALDLVRVVLWFNPLVHVMVGRYRRELEKERDADACRLGATPRALGRALLQVLEAKPHGAPVPRAGLAASTLLSQHPRAVAARLRNLGRIGPCASRPAALVKALLFLVVFPWQPNLAAHGFALRENPQAGGDSNGATVSIAIGLALNPIFRSVVPPAMLGLEEEP